MPVRNILILDTETNGLHPSKGALLIEIGALLYNIEHRKILQTLSAFLPCYENPVQHINNIEPVWTTQADGKWSVDALMDMSYNADCIVAHNAQFDKAFIESVVWEEHEFWKKKWICTKNDFKWPVHLARNRLQDVCNAMGVPYVDAHRALIDCHFLADCFSKVSDLQERFNLLVR